MLEALKFVRGSVARKDFVPSLTHFRIAERRIRGFNGAVALCCPIPLDLNVTPKADVFIHAVEACSEGTQLNLTEDKKLRIRSGAFQIFVDCLDEAFPNIAPEGKEMRLDGRLLLEAITALAPIIADDASRKWAGGILFRGASAFATNNVVLAEYWLGYNFPVEVNISKQAVQELLRIGEEPTSIQVSENSITFHYAGERWLRAQNIPATWPDVGAILREDSNPRPFPVGFFEAVEKLEPFSDELGQLFLSAGKMTTAMSSKQGASVELPDLVDIGVYHVEQLKLLKGLATTADLAKYPRPCLWFGEKIRGAIVGIRA